MPKERIYENTAFAYDTTNERAVQCLESFWDLYSSQRMTHRDQPLWAYTLRKHNVVPTVVGDRRTLAFHADAAAYFAEREQYLRGRRTRDSRRS